MSTSEERLKILKMIQEGKITAEEGIQLIEALDETTTASDSAQTDGSSIPSGSGRGGAKWLRVRVTDTKTGKVRVNVRLPVNVVSAGLKMGAKFSPEVECLDVDQLMTHIRSGETGQIVDVIDEQDSEHVEVFIE